MDRVTRTMATIALLVALGAVSACSSGAQQPSTAPQTETVPSNGSSATDSGTGATSEGEALAQQKCTMCHTYDRIASATKDKAEWEATVERMVDKGLVVTDEEKAAIIEYLSSK